MPSRYATRVFLGFLIFTFTTAAHASNKSCSFATTNGDWCFSYSGNVILPTGAVPVASVGVFKQTNGSLTGSETRSLGGAVADETITADCTVSYDFQVFDEGVLVRTAKVSVVFDDNGKSARGIFTSPVLTGGPAPPSVISMDARRLFPNE